MFQEMRDHLEFDELRQMLSRLTKLHSAMEPSALSERLEETLAKIEVIVDKGSHRD